MWCDFYSNVTAAGLRLLFRPGERYIAAIKFSYSTFEQHTQANHAYVFSKAKVQIDYYKQSPGEGFLLHRKQ